MGGEAAFRDQELPMPNDNIFSGLKVVDFASFIAGPSAAVILSDFGADVVKVEPPAGELWRLAHKIPPQPQAKDAYPWHLANRNKRGMTLEFPCVQPVGQHGLQRGSEIGAHAWRSECAVVVREDYEEWPRRVRRPVHAARSFRLGAFPSNQSEFG
jgi:hypothetical protein